MAGLTAGGSVGQIYDPQQGRAVPDSPAARARVAAYNASLAQKGAANQAGQMAQQSGGTVSYQTGPDGTANYSGTTAGGGGSLAGLRSAAGGGGGSQDEMALLRERARLQTEAENRRARQFSPTLNQPSVSYGGEGEEAARAAAFARAKDTAGQIARSSLNALRDVASSRGIGGSSIEGGMSADILGGQANSLGEFNREQLIQDLARQQHVADTTYAGNISQRGQNLGLAPSLFGLIGARAY